MSEPQTTTATAPAPVVSTPEPTISATFDAATRGDFSAFEQAHKAARDGKPLAAVPVPKADPAPAQAPAAADPVDPAAPAQPDTRPVSKRQQNVNDAIRDAVDRATADLRAELDRLRRPTPEAPKAAEAPAPAPERFPSIAEWSAKPENAQKTFEDYLDARDSWVEARRTAQAKQQTESEQRQTQHQQEAARFQERIQAANARDPEWHTRVLPALLEATPLSGCHKDAAGRFVDPNRRDASGQPLPINQTNAIAQVAWYSEHPHALMQELSKPDVADRLKDLPPDQFMAALYRIDGQLATAPTPASTAAPAAPAADSRSPISAAPPPPPTLGKPNATSDPKEAAVKTGDIRSFLALDFAEQVAKRKATA